MKKLTQNQILLIDEALKKIGVNYVDIRYEMVDHIAASLEVDEKDRPFEHNLKGYIIAHKKELLKVNRKYIFISWIQSWKGLFLNTITIQFVAFFGLLYLALTGLNSAMGKDSFVTLMFFVFCAANGWVTFPQVYGMIKKKNQYSVGEGLAVLNVFVFFPGLYMIKFMREISSDSMVTLYFTTLISVCAVMAVTLRRFKSNFKLRYNG